MLSHNRHYSYPASAATAATPPCRGDSRAAAAYTRGVSAAAGGVGAPHHVLRAGVAIETDCPNAPAVWPSEAGFSGCSSTGKMHPQSEYAAELAWGARFHDWRGLSSFRMPYRVHPGDGLARELSRNWTPRAAAPSFSGIEGNGLDGRIFGTDLPAPPPGFPVPSPADMRHPYKTVSSPHSYR